MNQRIVIFLKKYQKNLSSKFENTNKDNKGRYLWETTDTGIFVWRDLNSFFFQNNGKIEGMYKSFHPNGKPFKEIE